MKIGLSFSRCVRDIAEGRVALEDVLVIIARTHFDPRDDDQWRSIWVGYGGGTGGRTSIWSNPEWSCFGSDEEDRIREIAVELWITGRLHQPRQFGAHPTRRPEIWLEAVLPSAELERNPAVKKAWDNFQVVAGLSNVTLDKEYK